MEILAEKFSALEKSLKATKKPLLVVHPRPDTDALGSALSLAEYIKDKNNIDWPDIYSINEPAPEDRELFPIEKILIYKIDYQKYDSYIFIDRGDVYYKLGFDKKIKSDIPIINIDHHPNTFIPKALNVLDIKASATSEILFRFFSHIDYGINKKIAQYLLSGIFFDTGGFRHNNTSAQALEISGELLRKGATIGKINRVLYANKSINTLKLWGIALDRAKINPKTGMVVSFLTKEDIKRCGADAADISEISEILNTISESKFALILSERGKNKIKASLRSEEYKRVDVSEIAQEFQGGGHKLASGFEIKGHLRQVGDSWIIE